MKDELITFETAALAKEKGFDVPVTDAYLKDSGELYDEEDCPEKENQNLYPNGVSAPTQYLLQRWLREEKGIAVDVYTDLSLIKKGFKYRCDLIALFVIDCDSRTLNLGKEFTTYEQALEAGLQKALKLIKP